MPLNQLPPLKWCLGNNTDWQGARRVALRCQSFEGQLRSQTLGTYSSQMTFGLLLLQRRSHVWHHRSVAFNFAV